MTARDIHPELAAVFAEHASPTHASKDNVHAALIPHVTLMGNVQRQVLEYRHTITTAMLVPHDHELDSKLEYMDATLSGLEAAAARISKEMRDLAQAFVRLDQYMAEWQRDIARWQQVGSQPPPVALPPLLTTE